MLLLKCYTSLRGSPGDRDMAAQAFNLFCECILWLYWHEVMVQFCNAAQISLRSRGSQMLTKSNLSPVILLFRLRYFPSQQLIWHNWRLLSLGLLIPLRIRREADGGSHLVLRIRRVDAKGCMQRHVNVCRINLVITLL